MDLFIYITVGLALILVIGLAALYLLKDIQVRLDQLQHQELNRYTDLRAHVSGRASVQDR
jgi:hypothetical protein